MTIEEAQAVARIIGQADGGCDSCVGKLVEEANKLLAQFVWTEGEWIRVEEGDNIYAYIDVKVTER